MNKNTKDIKLLVRNRLRLRRSFRKKIIRNELTFYIGKITDPIPQGELLVIQVLPCYNKLKFVPKAILRNDLTQNLQLCELTSIRDYYRSKPQTPDMYHRLGTV